VRSKVFLEETQAYFWGDLELARLQLTFMTKNTRYFPHHNVRTCACVMEF
jgi:hypothetical protein